MKPNIFKDASVRLASLYLIIIMAISLLFSFWLYNVSLNEIRQSIRRMPGPIQRILLNDNPNFALELRESQEDAVKKARDNLVYQLGLLNVMIAITGASISYFIARHTLKPIEEAHEAQSKFTADASHELRTPITAMRIETELTLTEPKLSLNQAKKQLESNIEELDKLTGLSENLLKLARLDNDTEIRKRVRLDDILKVAIDRVTLLASTKKQTLEYSNFPRVKLLANEASLTEALITILDNAIKYSPQNSLIKLKAEHKDKTIAIQIIDQGIGIPLEEIPHIFDRFYRVDSSRNKNMAAGYGIGLAIAKSSVEAHGGTIDVSSKPNHGTTFTIMLPL